MKDNEEDEGIIRKVVKKIKKMKMKWIMSKIEKKNNVEEDVDNEERKWKSRR